MKTNKNAFNPPKDGWIYNSIESIVAAAIIVSTFIGLSVCPLSNVNAQGVGINPSGSSPNSSAALDVDFTNKGVLIPRVILQNTADASTIANPATTLLVYNLGTGGLTPAGYYYNAGTPASPNWTKFVTGGGSGWSLTGNSGTVDGTNFIGSTDNVPFTIRVNNQRAARIENTNGNTGIGYQVLNVNTGTNNTANGYQALKANTTGVNNVASGWQALLSNTIGSANDAYGYIALSSNTTGSYNNAMGQMALYSNTTGNHNDAIGNSALFSNTVGFQNVACGSNALYANTTASNNVAIGHQSLYTQSFNNGGNSWSSDNTAVGYEALYSNQPTATSEGKQNTATGSMSLFSNTIGFNNTASGYKSLYNNTTGISNTALGYLTLQLNTIAGGNTAVGDEALSRNTTGEYNTATGMFALWKNNTAQFNTATGYTSLFQNTSGNQNTSVGAFALQDNTSGFGNTALGVQAGDDPSTGFYNTTGSNNTFIGYNSGLGSATQRNNATAIGNQAKVDASNALVLGGTGANAVNVGIGTTTPASTFSVGASSQFQVNSTGNLTKINNVVYSFPASQGGASTALQNDGSGNLSWVSAGAPIYSSFATTVFENSSRFGTSSGNGGAISFNGGGANNSTSGTAGGWAQTTWSIWYSNATDIMANSPTVSTTIMTNSQLGSDFDIFVGIGNPTTGPSGITFTNNHAGFKLKRTGGGTISLYATQANGSTETASAALTNIDVWYDIMELIIKVNSTTSITYYWRTKFSTSLSSTTLTTNMPTGQEFLSLCISNRNVASASSMLWTAAHYQH